jgi:hypothetical protein
MQLPPNLYNSPWYQNMMGAQAQNQGPQWSESNPFRTVDNGLQFGAGNNASAGQLYEHFHRQAALDKRAGDADASIERNYGLTPGSKFQSVSDFMDQRKQDREDASGIWGNHTQAYKDRVGELMENRGWTQQYSMGNQNHALGVNADFGGDGAVSNNEWARHLGADYDNDGNVTGKEWTQYGGQSPSQGFPPRPGNIPNMGPGIFNFQPPGAQGGGLNPGMGTQPMPPQRPSPQTNPDVMPGQWQSQPPVRGGGGLNPGISPQQGPTQAPMTNPQVPAFDPSIFNMQPAGNNITPHQWQPTRPVRNGGGLNPGMSRQR